MADKIVQLVDANDDNIFPLSSDPNAAHITMTMTDPGEGVALGQNEFVAVYGGDPIILDYSTVEINTGAKWIDGSSIYKKTVNCGELPGEAEKTVQHGISNLNRVIKIEGYSYNSNNGITLPIPFSWIIETRCIGVTIDTTTIKIRADLDRTGYTETYITLYYTKSS